MIYLIRHGETEANIKHIYCGSTDLPLSEAGVEKLQARKKDETIRRVREDAARFVTSGMTRMPAKTCPFFTGRSPRFVAIIISPRELI